VSRGFYLCVLCVPVTPKQAVRRYERYEQMIAPRWEATPCDEAATGALAAALRVAPPVARLLCQRGFSDPELAARFLNPTLDHLHDPWRLADMGVAVDRLLSAIARKERIAI